MAEERNRKIVFSMITTIGSLFSRVGAFLASLSSSENEERSATHQECVITSEKMLDDVKSSETVVCIGDFTIPDGSFEGNQYLTHLVFDGQTVVGKHAFDGCPNLKTVTFLGEVDIKESGFYGCKSLERVTFSEKVTLGEYAFGACTRLLELSIPEGTLEIGENVFYGCISLEKVDLPKTLTSLGEYAFGVCRELRLIRLGGLVCVHRLAFHECLPEFWKTNRIELCRFLSDDLSEYRQKHTETCSDPPTADLTDGVFISESEIVFPPSHPGAFPT